jgi:SAM-dependent methyltransferase
VYDREYEGLYGIRRLRSIISSAYLEYFSAPGNLLELNCGTGTDAIFLGKRGFNVLATDLSPNMIDEVQKKVASQGFQERVRTRVMKFSELGVLHGMKFDGAYSNMGGINCTHEIGPIATHLASLINEGGYFIATVMPNFCLWETVAFLSRFRWKEAFRRRKTAGCAAHLHGGTVRTFYHSPRNFAASFSFHFEVVELTGLNILTPPPNSRAAYRFFPSLMRLLERLDDAISHTYPFTSIGDHYVIVLRRKAS